MPKLQVWDALEFTVLDEPLKIKHDFKELRVYKVLQTWMNEINSEPMC